MEKKSREIGGTNKLNICKVKNSCRMMLGIRCIQEIYLNGIRGN